MLYIGRLFSGNCGDFSPMRGICYWATILLAIVTQVASAAPTADEIAKAVESLSDLEFEKRQSATELLWQAGEAAETALEQAAKDTDPEVRTRATALLKKLRLGIRPDTPPEVLLLIDQFRYAQSPEQRRQALSELQAKERWQTILALIRGEQNLQERRNLATAIVPQAAKFIGPLVEKGELGQAEEVLDLVATTEAGLPQLTVFLLLTGRIDKRIEAAREQASESSNDESWTRLAYLLRAKGDLSEAIEAADKTNDLILRVNLRAEAGRFREAAPLAEEFYRRNASRLEGMSFATTFYHLAANEVEHQRTLDALLKAANVERLKEMAEKPADPFVPRENLAVSHFATAAKTLLVNERIDEGLAIMRKINPPLVHTVLWQQHRHQEALEFASVTPEKRLDRAWLEQLPTPPPFLPVHPDYRFIMATQVARHLRELGRSEQVDQVWRTLRELETTPADRARRLMLLMNLAWQLGRQDEATKLAAEAITAGVSPSQIFGILARRESPLALAWHERLLAADPQIERSRAIALAVSMVQANPRRGGPPANWREMITQARESVQNMGPRQKAERLVAYGQTAKIRGDAELAKQLFVEAAAVFPASAMHLGDALAVESDWIGAAKQYAAVVKANPADLLTAYLWGHALEQAGEAEASRQQLLTANLNVLAPDSRFAMAKAFIHPSLKGEVVRQCELISRTALPDSQIGVNAAQEIGNIVSTNEPQRSAQCWQQILLHVLNPSTNFSEAEGYPVLPHVIHKVLARAAIGEGKAEIVEAELARCQKILPGDVRMTVELIPVLKKAEMGKIADDLFERAMTNHRQVIEAFPNSATNLNNAAWICSRAQRELEEGLKLALKAVELAPEEAAYRDTLAEVHFQRGEREKAVAAAQKCLEIAPANATFAKRLKHFQEDELKTLDGTEE